MRGTNPVQSGIENWLENPLGRCLLDAETRVASEYLASVFGFQTVQVGHWGPGNQFGNHSRTQSFALVADTPGPDTCLVTPASALAICSDSVDAVILPHTLEIDPNPHQVLREAERILAGEGHLLVLGFSPASLWGLRHKVSRKGFPPDVRRMVSEYRLRDWLRLLGFEVLGARGYCAGPPGNRPDWLRNSWLNAPTDNEPLKLLAGAYCLLARKHMLKPTLLKSKPARRRRVIGGLAEPTTRNTHGGTAT